MGDWSVVWMVVVLSQIRLPKSWCTCGAQQSSYSQKAPVRDRGSQGCHPATQRRSFQCQRDQTLVECPEAWCVNICGDSLWPLSGTGHDLPASTLRLPEYCRFFGDPKLGPRPGLTCRQAWIGSAFTGFSACNTAFGVKDGRYIMGWLAASAY